MSSGQLRIIAGAQRGRRIAVPPGAGVRPTADRAREALFSILGPAVSQARVLDAYAGTGALGFEALSRGAARALFIEVDRQACAALAANAAALGLAERCTVRQGRVLDLLASGAVAGPFDLLLADPPYDSGEGLPFLAAAAGLVTRSGLIVLEREACRGSGGTELPGLEQLRTACYGRCCLDFFRRRA